MHVVLCWIRWRLSDGGLRDAIAVLLQRAQSAGAVRSDIGVPEVIAVPVAASRAVELAGPDRALQKRTMAVLLDGLRPRTPPRRRRR
ncbi:MAG TPA: hypothetical protein VFK02_05065 [Kofleriaceae bacterium]|nr:hypothetical protein [Kofleriaceae bacterium]